ncbi:hypothetical protein FB446DRAFT_513194 [Lentinula raphanica]|nr:hypothetical protein FB446DRAFT_513194 [Lentinula raphanica]
MSENVNSQYTQSLGSADIDSSSDRTRATNYSSHEGNMPVYGRSLVYGNQNTFDAGDDYYQPQSHTIDAETISMAARQPGQSYYMPPYTSNMMRPPSLPMVDTNFSYIPNTQPPTSWSNSANTPFNPMPTSPFPFYPENKAAALAYDQNQLDHASYASPYSLTSGEAHFMMGPRVDDTVAIGGGLIADSPYSPTGPNNFLDDTVAIDGGFVADNPSSSSSHLPAFPIRKTVGSLKVKQQANSKRKTTATFRCKYCGSDFTAKHNLQYHENSHEGKKPYPCPYCIDKAFTVPRSRDRHVKTCKEKPKT